SYVRDHPNRPLLDDVFREMAELAREFDVQVTVLLAPTAARLHGPYFQAFPAISERPYFLEYVGSVAGSVGFEVVDLHDFLVPDGGRELLFFRDDDHFNVRGHERVAEIVQRELFPFPEQEVDEDPPPGQ
ncbi:MAG: SGNH/GDSL hydrolase family protein, partial [Gemmatimonadota bacterium]|nr:SGNH/GDSL hydrolase family protein [Gemmatimonadota bacterium]